MNSQPIHLELDPGAEVMIVSEQVYNKCLRHVPWSTAELQTYTAEKLKILGKCQVSIEYQNQEMKMDVYVVPGKGPSFWTRFASTDQVGLGKYCSSAQGSRCSRSVRQAVFKVSVSTQR